MGIVKSRGVVISNQDSGETSRLAEVFTEQYGLLKVMAKGARRPESRFGAATESLTTIQGVYYLKDDSDIANLSAADIISPMPKIHEDVEKIAYASGWAEFLSFNLPYGEPQQRLYIAFLTALSDMEEIPSDQNVKFFWAHMLKFIAILGFRPEFLICAGCSIGKSEDWMFSVENGRLYCKNCSRSLRDSLFIRLDSGETRILSIFLNGDRSVLFKLNINEQQMKTVISVVEGFRKYHTEPQGDLKSLKFVDDMSREKTD